MSAVPVVVAVGWPVGNPFEGLWELLQSPFTGLVGWAGDQLFDRLTAWIARGCAQLLGFVWMVMDTTSSPRLDAPWFSSGPSSPYRAAASLGVGVLLLVVLVAVVHGVVAGDPGGIVRRVMVELPLTVLAMGSLVAVTQAGLGVADAMAATVWDTTRDQSVTVFDNLARTTLALPAGTFLAPLVLLVLLAALLFLWLVLFIRDTLIYLVVVLAVTFGLPALVWPTLRGMARHTLELLVALILAKPVIALALSVGVGAMSGVGATGRPGDEVVENGLAEFGTVVVGIVAFGLAAFMPYLVYRLVPVAAAAGVAAGVASGPMRAGSTGMQFQYYAQSTLHRLGGTSHDVFDLADPARTGHSPPDGAAGGGSAVRAASSATGVGGPLAGGPAGAGAAAAGSGSSAAAGGAAAGPVGVGVTVAARAASLARDTAEESTPTQEDKTSDG